MLRAFSFIRVAVSHTKNESVNFIQLIESFPNSCISTNTVLTNHDDQHAEYSLSALTKQVNMYLNNLTAGLYEGLVIQLQLYQLPSTSVHGVIYNQN